MLKFKNVSGSELAVFKPEGDPQSRTVAPGGVLEVNGVLAVEDVEDAYVVDVDGDKRAFPHALWELDKPKTAAKPADKES